jgi:hypothetical protein
MGYFLGCHNDFFFMKKNCRFYEQKNWETFG